MVLWDSYDRQILLALYRFADDGCPLAFDAERPSVRRATVCYGINADIRAEAQAAIETLVDPAPEMVECLNMLPIDESGPIEDALKGGFLVATTPAAERLLASVIRNSEERAAAARLLLAAELRRSPETPAVLPEIVESLQSAPASVPVNAVLTAPEAPIVDLAKKTVAYGGETYDVKSEQALRMLKILASSPGEWFRPKQLEAADEELIGLRTDRLKKDLPSRIRKLIDSQRGAGVRLLLA
jgi:hypothetical protein